MVFLLIPAENIIKAAIKTIIGSNTLEDPIFFSIGCEKFILVQRYDFWRLWDYELKKLDYVFYVSRKM
jgi:hypothetical protein